MISSHDMEDPRAARRKTLILFRTHFVDERVRQNVSRLAAGGDYDVRIAVDETSGPIDCGDLPKLSITLDSCVRLGLPVDFPTPLWRCGDYIFYHALALGYRRYWSIEYDIALNFADPLDFFRLLDEVADENYLTTFLEPAPRDWMWRFAAELRFGVVYASGFALVRLSADAVGRLLEGRRSDAEWLRKNAREAATDWMNDETFVSSSALALGLGMADINKYGDFYTAQTLARGGLLHSSQTPEADNKIYHAVRSGPSYMRAVQSYYDVKLKDFLRFAEPDTAPGDYANALKRLLTRALETFSDDPNAVFAPDGPLAEALPHLGAPRVATALLHTLGARRMRLSLEALQLGRIAVPIGHSPALDNVALGRSAWQSSTSARARHRDPRIDAEGGNDGDASAEFGFHTAYQDRPWWAVDLGHAYRVRMVRLFNRRLSEPKLSRFVVEASLDFVQWRTIYAHSPADWELLLARPIELVVEPAVTARYVRIQLARAGVLHLAEVEVLKA